MVSTSLAEHGYISISSPAERNQLNSIRHVSDSFIAADRRGIQKIQKTFIALSTICIDYP
jgi:hypothetical protein